MIQRVKNSVCYIRKASILIPQNLMFTYNQTMTEEYSYFSSDDSVLSKILYEPVTHALVTQLPSSLSPNVLTLCALITIAIASLAEFTALSPRSRHFLPLFLFTYQIFDSLDGKHARRNKRSSALGECLDHGGDALCAVSFLFMIGTTFRLGKNASLFLAVMYWNIILFTHIESVTIKRYTFGMISAPTDGVFMLSTLKLLNTWVPEDGILRLTLYEALAHDFKQFLILIAAWPTIRWLVNFMYMVYQQKLNLPAKYFYIFYGSAVASLSFGFIANHSDFYENLQLHYSIVMASLVIRFLHTKFFGAGGKAEKNLSVMTDVVILPFLLYCTGLPEDFCISYCQVHSLLSLCFLFGTLLFSLRH